MAKISNIAEVAKLVSMHKMLRWQN